MAITAFRERIAPLLDHIAAGAIDRDARRELPRDEVRALLDAGLGALRVPVEYGGGGASIPELIEVLIELATADSNLPQIFRGHLAFVEDVLATPEGPWRRRWIDRIVANQLVGNAWSETHNTVGAVATTVRLGGDGWIVDGRKYYTTGSIFADWIDATVTGPKGEALTAIIRVDQPTLRIADDWDGFGQRTTGTGSIALDGVAVAADDVRPFADRFRYQLALYQTVLNAVLAGIAAAVERDAVAALAARTRTFSHGAASSAAEDPQLLQAVGEVSATAFAARATVVASAAAVQAAADTAAHRDSEEDAAANIAADLAAARAQTVLVRAVPEAASRLFDVLGASGTSSGAALDRHWRNARTVASHNPWVYKARLIGAHAVSGASPIVAWSVGASASRVAE